MIAHGNRPWVAYVGPFPYPEGAAASRRVLGVAESLSLAGFDVVVASGSAQSLHDAGQLVQQDEGIAWCRLPERVAEHWPRPLRRFRYALMGRRTVEWLAAQATLPAAVIIYSGYTPYLRQILPWCQRNRVRLLFDAVEWYEPERRWGYLTSPYQWNIEYAMRWLIPKVDGVIAISRYLADYYGTRGLPVAIVPPTTSAISPGPWKADACLRLCYAGNPGHKDDLGGILRAVANLAEKGAPIQLTVAGPTRSEVFRLIGQQDGPDIPWLRTPGMLEHGEVQRLVGSADFSILARQPSRTAQAGFPTKFVESFASGTPVIANLTSDLHLHLRDGETGLVCALPDADSIAAAVTRALALDGNALSRMRGACSEHARQSFHPSGFADVLYDLIQQEPNK